MFLLKCHSFRFWWAAYSFFTLLSRTVLNPAVHIYDYLGLSSYFWAPTNKTGFSSYTVWPKPSVKADTLRTCWWRFWVIQERKSINWTLRSNMFIMSFLVHWNDVWWKMLENHMWQEKLELGLTVREDASASLVYLLPILQDVFFWKCVVILFANKKSLLMSDQMSICCVLVSKGRTACTQCKEEEELYRIDTWGRTCGSRGWRWGPSSRVRLWAAAVVNVLRFQLLGENHERKEI